MWRFQIRCCLVKGTGNTQYHSVEKHRHYGRQSRENLSQCSGYCSDERSAKGVSPCYGVHYIGHCSRKRSNGVNPYQNCGRRWCVADDVGRTKALAAGTAVMTGAQWALNTAMMANPIGLVIAGVMALIACGFGD
ncbi:hypothetical protein DYL72_21665 (plasmid) [Vibrio anguillarum]|uniref:Uncharacterized protein n=1 Tax=Vibrio anguillarum TaxID=55601 RepID=A0A7U6FUD5_VIBAN|nr:hypothetical protein [Vibrio anguillarum]AZS27521.1 hypothetical protein DYL72_21665 [Vibrio anguillarum]